MNRAGKQFGSDVYAHYTAVYTWDSNQMAHAMMGFAGTTLFIHTAARFGLEFWYGALFYIIPFLKDLTDIIADQRSGPTPQFEMNASRRREIWLDALTDNFFWLTGMILALFVMAMDCENRPWWVCVVILAGFLVFGSVIFLARLHFGKQKRQFDISGLPYFFRLPCFPGKLAGHSNNNGIRPKDEIENFVNRDRKKASHLLLYGPQHSFKTTLAVAIGSGLTVRRQAVRYLSKARLIEEYTPPIRTGHTVTEAIPPHKADIVIIDDLHHPDGLTNVFPALVGKSTVWVVPSKGIGIENSNGMDFEKWVEVITNGLKVEDGRNVEDLQKERLVPIELDKPQEGPQQLPDNLPTPLKILAPITLIISFGLIAFALGSLMMLPPCEVGCF